MPTYNRKDCIKNAIDSLLVQTYKNFELIVVDDGSTDGTEEYLEEIYKKEIKREKIKFIKLSENKGAAFARNEGLKYAQYDWIGYLDTDNQMLDVFLEAFADSIKKNPTYEIFYAQIKHTQSHSIIGREFDFNGLVIENFIDLGVFVHSVKIYNELGGFDINLNRLIDWDLIIRYTEKYSPKFIEKVLLNYCEGSEFERISNKNHLDENYKEVIINYYKRIPAQNFIKKYQENTRDLINKNLAAQQIIYSLYNSYSWKITKPLRWFHPRIFKGFYFFFPYGSKRWLLVKTFFRFCYRPKWIFRPN